MARTTGAIGALPAGRLRVDPDAGTRRLCDNRRRMALVDSPSSGRRPVAARLEGDEPLALGVAAAAARRFDVDALSVRAAFVVLTVAGGWGAALYLVGWVFWVWRTPPPVRPMPSQAQAPLRRFAVLCSTVGPLLILRARLSGFADQLVWPTAGVTAAVVVGWQHLAVDLADGSANPDAGRLPWPLGHHPRGHLLRAAGGLLLVVGGLAYLTTSGRTSVGVLRDGLVAVAVVTAGVLLVFAPWVVQLTRSLTEERRERVRADERAEVAMHLHDSVLQTLTLLQKRADDPKTMAALARRQERELRRWLYGMSDPHDGRGFREAVEAMVTEVEDQHLVKVDNVTVGDAPLEPVLRTVIAAAREALVNAARFSGERTVSLYAELRPQHVELYVRDRGVGFCLDEVADDRRGISESIVARVHRIGGTAHVRTAPGAGTEVRIRLERSV
jgi:signal transduction histidine kinase